MNGKGVVSSTNVSYSNNDKSGSCDADGNYVRYYCTLVYVRPYLEWKNVTWTSGIQL